MIKLSVVIITYNEERNIVRCLASIKDLADEIVIVDSFSNDKTIQLAESFAAIIYQHKFEGHIEQKNFALTKASFDHVLSLDADESLDSELAAQISMVKKNFTCDGYYLKRLTNYCGHWVRYCGWYPDKKLRLFDRRKGTWSGMNPHDKYMLHEGDFNTQLLKGDILHFSYYTVREHIKQMEYFASIAAKAMYLKGKAPLWIQLFLNPALHFVKSYFIKLGFLDGWRGVQICAISSYGTYLKYKKLFNYNKLSI